MKKEFSEVKQTSGIMEYNTGMKRELDEGRPRPSLISPYMLIRLAKHLVNGAKKYSDDNWTLGAPYRRFMDSIMRHWIEIMKGDDSEDHLSAIIFNAMAIIHFQETGRDEELNNLPKWGGKNENV